MEDYLSEALQTHETPLESVDELREIVASLPCDSRRGSHSRQQILNSSNEVLELMLKLVNFEIADRDKCGVFFAHAREEDLEREVGRGHHSGHRDGCAPQERVQNFKACVVCGTPDCKHTCPCKQALYCGQECQRKHWRKHKLTCAVFLAKKDMTVSQQQQQQQQQHSYLRFRPTRGGGGNTGHGRSSAGETVHGRSYGCIDGDASRNRAIHGKAVNRSSSSSCNSNSSNNIIEKRGNDDDDDDGDDGDGGDDGNNNKDNKKLALDPEYSKWLCMSSLITAIM
jgi:hypothetical protein